MKRMLINATQKEELRIALVDGQYLYDLDIESVGREQKKANIYKGVITKVNPSLEAVFVAYGGERDGFLPFKDIADSYFPLEKGGKRNIRDLKEGQEVLVQIEKEIRGKKGAALTTYISLAGSFLVLKPNDDRSGGISRHIQGRSRIELKKHLNEISIPKEMSVIARTASLDKTQSELQQDLDVLIQYWKEIQEEYKKHPAPILIHKEIDVITRVFRDYLRDDISEILLDNALFLDKAKKSLIDLGRADFIEKLHLYQGEIGLFNHFQIEHQIESAFSREVRLRSGGSIVIDVTEALTAIDINSSKSTKGADIEETALSTNLEAAEEIARQLRFRDLGGLIVIDFIDMKSIKNQRAVEDCLKEHIKSDRARIQITKISRFGLIEMSRQRLSSSLKEATHHICPRCEGTGTIRDNNSLSLSILRLIQEAVLKENTAQVDVIVPVEIASYLLNEKRQDIAQIEANSPLIKVVIAADSQMDTPAYKLIRKRSGEESGVLSYQLPKLVREQEEVNEFEQVEMSEPEKALLDGFKIEQTLDRTKSHKNGQKSAQSSARQDERLGFLSKLKKQITKWFAPTESEVAEKMTQVAEHAKKEGAGKNAVPVKNKPSNRSNRYRNESVKPQKKTDFKNNVKESHKKESSLKDDQNIAPVKTEKTTITPFVPKVKREKRVLAQSVRAKATQTDQISVDKEKKEESVKNVSHDVSKKGKSQVDTKHIQNKEAQVRDAVVFIVAPMPSLLTSVAQFEGVAKKEHYKFRPRRTLRHLRMNNQRKRRQNYKEKEFQKYVPAVSILEIALCRVYSYSVPNDSRVSSSFERINYPNQGQLLQAVSSLSGDPLEKEDHKVQDKKTSSKPSLIQNKSTQVDLLEEDLLQQSAKQIAQQDVDVLVEQVSYHAFAPITKAPSVVMNVAPSEIKIRMETLLFNPNSKGAGGLTAKEHAYSSQSKS